MTGELPDERPDEARHRWKIRKVGQADVPPDQLLANPWNARVHPRAQAKAVEASLDLLGWIAEIRVNINTGHVFDGHLRIADAIDAQEPTVPVCYYDLTEQEERQAIAVFDAIGGMAIVDEQSLSANLAALPQFELPLRNLMAELLHQEAEGDDLPAGGDDDLPENSLAWGYVTAGKTRVECSSAEVDQIESLYKSYKAENGGHLGFVAWLADGER